MSEYSDWRNGVKAKREQWAKEHGYVIKEKWEESHYSDEIPFYTDDPDDPHWRCENCGHCKQFKAFRPIIKFSTYVDENGYVHNNPNKPIPENLFARWNVDHDYIKANICELTASQVFDDDYCEEFMEEDDTE